MENFISFKMHSFDDLKNQKSVVFKPEKHFETEFIHR